MPTSTPSPMDAHVWLLVVNQFKEKEHMLKVQTFSRHQLDHVWVDISAHLANPSAIRSVRDLC